MVLFFINKNNNIYILYKDKKDIGYGNKKYCKGYCYTG